MPLKDVMQVKNQIM